MAVAFGSISSTTYASRTNTTITAPTGITLGDFLIIAGFTANNTEAPDIDAVPSGFSAPTPSSGTWPIDVTTSGFNAEGRAYTKVADSGDVAASNFTLTHVGATSMFAMIRITGQGVSPLAVGPTLNSGTGTTSTATGLTTTVDGTMLVYIGFDYAGVTANTTVPSGSTPTFTERLDGTALYVATGVQSSAGATGSKTATNGNSTGSDFFGAMLIAVAPDPTAGFVLLPPPIVAGPPYAQQRAASY